MTEERRRLEAILFDPDWVEALRACEPRPSRRGHPLNFTTLATPVRTCLAEMTTDAPAEQAYKAAAVLQTLGAVPVGAWRRLLASGDEHARIQGIRLAAAEGEEGKRALLQSAGDPHYRCRKAVLPELASLGDDESRATVLAAVADVSGSVQRGSRPADRRTPLDAVDPGSGAPATRSVPRNRPVRQHMGIPSFASRLRRAGKFPSLPADVLDEVMRMFEWSNVNEDNALQNALLELLSQHPYPPLVPFLAGLLDSRVSVSNLSEPLFQLRASAAWALLRQVCRFAKARTQVPLLSLFMAAVHPDPLLAAPALLSFGVLARRTVGQLESLHRHEEMTEHRAALVFLGALGGKVPLDKSHLTSVAVGHPLLVLTPGKFDFEKVASWDAFASEHAEIATWVQSMDDKDPVQRAVRWASGNAIR